MKLLRLLLVPFAALVVIAARLGLPLRFGMIWSARMGHMAGNMECYLCEREAGLSKGWDLWHYGGKPCSAQLDKMLRRVVWIDRTGFTRICALVNELFEGKEKHQIDTAQVDRDIHNLFERQRPHLYFTDRELEFGHNSMKRMGIKEGSSAKWVYLVVRDSAKHPHLPYHSYRNCDIAAFEQAAIALAERGYYVIRDGRQVAKPFGVKHPKIIDFAMRKPYDDFMSIYLGAKCEFCLSTGTGPDAIPVIFRRPVCYVNYVPIEYLQTYHKGSLAIWKHHEKDGKRMTLVEIYESKAGHFMAAQEFVDAGITLVDNTPDEITAVALEMADNAPFTNDTLWYGNYNNYENQSAFWDKFPRGTSAYNERPLHGKINMRIGAEFLKGYQ